MLEPLTAHVTWIVLLAHSWSLHGLNKIVNRFLGALRAAVYGGHMPRRATAALAWRLPRRWFVALGHADAIAAAHARTGHDRNKPGTGAAVC
ncbi:hypothetical protein GDR29_10475 [Xanthomonas oryzae pv. oryzae]|nr:hypothetical protein GDR29_10475 [Xanthomonas oryzae pv. oryzae]